VSVFFACCSGFTQGFLSMLYGKTLEEMADGFVAGFSVGVSEFCYYLEYREEM